MRILPILSCLVVAALAGCVSSPPPTEPLEEQAAPPAVLEPVLEAVVATWDGRVTASQLGAVAHMRETETLVADVQREGFVFEVAEPPQDLQVELAWAGTLPGEMLVMVSSPSVDGKGVEYFSAWSAEGPLCIRVPAEEITPGKWQVMAHSRDAVDVDFTFTVTTLGGAAMILEGEPHSSAEAAETTEGEALPCEPPAEAPEA